MNDYLRRPIYLDYNATTPLSSDVADAMRPFLSGVFGNPSSEHPFGAEAKLALDNARRQIANFLGASPEEIVFTSGGTESNNLAIKGVVHAAGGRRHVVCSAIEHPAVSEVVLHLEHEGVRVTTVQVDASGRVNPDDVASAMSDETVLVTVMLANNEVGTIQAIAEIADIAHARGAYMHTDAAQAIGKIPVSVDDLNVDLLSIAGHKFYAPKGVGALYVRSGTRLERETQGASHERGLRPGTENVMFAVALGCACENARRHVEGEMPRVVRLRDRFEAALLDRLGSERARINAAAAQRLPNTSSVSFLEIEANTLLAEIGNRVAASAGAACHAESVEISSVLAAMGIPERWAMGTVRFSLGLATTEDEIDQAIETVCGAVQRLSGERRPSSIHESPGSEIRLTRYTHGMGCACKIRPQILESILADLPVRPDERVLVDASTSDDAGVYKISEDVALVQTVDFFTPIVDDPYAFGAVAAANALSDIYAMGARPVFALNIVGFPSQRLPQSVLHDILRGASDKCAEAGISIIGGHTIEDTEPKFGLAVTGVIDPSKILRNSGARVGDVLIITKPLGTGIIATAIKRGLAGEGDAAEMTKLMTELNGRAAATMEGFSVHACTDVTGFGFLGHLLEMTTGSGVEAEVSAASVPVLTAARRLAEADVVPGGTLDNLEHVGPHVRFDEPMSQSQKRILADAQTSGGLLISVDPADSTPLLKLLHEAGISAARQVGRVTGEGNGTIHVVH